MPDNIVVELLFCKININGINYKGSVENIIILKSKAAKILISVIFRGFNIFVCDLFLVFRRKFVRETKMLPRMSHSPNNQSDSNNNEWNGENLTHV